MAEKKINTRIIQKHDSKANWDKATNFYPKLGEIIIYDDENKIKIGDGKTLPKNLPYFGLDESGKIPLDQIPSNLKSSLVKNSISERDSISEKYSGLQVYVLDATGDSSVKRGGASYIWSGNSWTKISESESLDLVLSWNNITNKPTSFTPSKHTHLLEDILDFQDFQNLLSWNDLGSAPPRKEYYITFNPNGGTVSINQKRTVNGKIQDFPIPSWNNHTHLGWYTLASGGSLVDSNTTFYNNSEVYAHWRENAQPVQEYTITFNPNGGYVYPTSSKTVNHRLQSLPNPTKDKNTFNKWTLQNTPSSTTVTTGTVFSNNSTIFAQWTPDAATPPPGDNYKANFSENTWDQIISACQSKKVPATWKAGDSKPLSIGGQNYTIRILGKNHDTYANSATKAPLTFESVELLPEVYQMNTSSATSNWKTCKMRTETLPSVLNSMPSNVKNAIKEVQKYSAKGNGQSGTEISNDKLWIMAEGEIFGKTSGYAGSGYSSDAEIAAVEQYDVFKGSSDIPNKYQVNNPSKAKGFWTRSPYTYTGYFCTSEPNGSKSSEQYQQASAWMGINFCFCF